MNPKTCGNGPCLRFLQTSFFSSNDCWVHYQIVIVLKKNVIAPPWCMDIIELQMLYLPHGVWRRRLHENTSLSAWVSSNMYRQMVERDSQVYVWFDTFKSQSVVLRYSFLPEYIYIYIWPYIHEGSQLTAPNLVNRWSNSCFPEDERILRLLLSDLFVFPINWKLLSSCVSETLKFSTPHRVCPLCRGDVCRSEVSSVGKTC